MYTAKEELNHELVLYRVDERQCDVPPEKSQHNAPDILLFS